MYMLLLGIFRNYISFYKLLSMREEDANRLNEEYQRMVQGLKDAQVQRETDMVMANPVLPADVLKG